MARTVAELPSGTRITDFISLGVVTKTFPITTIESILKETGKASIRKRDLPAQVVIYYVIALAFYMQSSYREVLRCLLVAIRGLMHEAALRVDEDADGLSFLHAVRVVRRKIASFAAIPPSGEKSIS